MSRIKILFLYSASGYGGIVRNLSLLIGGLDRSIFDPHVVLLAGSSLDSTLDIATEIPQLRIPDSKLECLGSLKALRQYIVTNQIALVSTHGYKADIYIALLRTLRRIQVAHLAIAHGWVTPGIKMSCYHFLDKLALRTADRIILVAAGQRRELAWFGFDQRRIRVVHNGISTKTIDATRPLAASDVGLSGESRILGIFGRLSPEKGHETALHAVAKLVLRGCRTTLLIVGSGDEEQRLRELTRTLKLEQVVKFLGFRADALSLYGVCDIVLSPSTHEGLSNTILEALAFGKPCIASRIPGSDEIIEDGVSGLLFEAGNASELADLIEWTLSDPNRGRSIGTVGRLRVESQFSLSERVKQISAIYLELCRG